MNRIIPITACGVENMSATKIAELLWEQEREIERLTAEVARFTTGTKPQIAMKEPRNRVLTLDEVLALPNGSRVWVEINKPQWTIKITSGWRIRAERDGEEVMLDICGHAYFSLIKYNSWSRCWSSGEPTPAESASIPWKEAPDA